MVGFLDCSQVEEANARANRELCLSCKARWKTGHFGMARFPSVFGHFTLHPSREIESKQQQQQYEAGKLAHFVAKIGKNRISRWKLCKVVTGVNIWPLENNFLQRRYVLTSIFLLLHVLTSRGLVVLFCLKSRYSHDCLTKMSNIFWTSS